MGPRILPFSIQNGSWQPLTAELRKEARFILSQAVRAPTLSYAV